MKTKDYNKQGEYFLTSTNTKMDISYKGYDYHFAGDKDKRDIYTITLSRNSRKYTFDFGQSIHHSGRFILGYKKIPGGYQMREIKPNPNYSQPTAYDILTCLQKYDAGTFDNFISEFGYEFSSVSEYKAIKKIYKAVCKEFDNVQKLWSEEEIEQLQEIQ